MTPDNADEYENLFQRFNVGDDCPIFDGIYDFCQRYAGATIEASRKLIAEGADICINWSGGLHHAKKSEASGFCYVNDIVLGILELLRFSFFEVNRIWMETNIFFISIKVFPTRVIY